MKAQDFFTSFLVTGLTTFVVAAVVSYLYSLTVHGAGVVDWETSVRMGLILGIGLPLVKAFERKKG